MTKKKPPSEAKRIRPKRPARARPVRAPPPPSPPASEDPGVERDEQGGVAFPIVGVGASAGGLDAFTQLLGALPVDTGMGYVLVQHLDPEHESALVQILSRATTLPVREIADGMTVLPDQVHVIPRDTSLSIVGGVLRLQPRQRTRTPNRPIDAFFESLARDLRERAVGVVLSGTATDGTLGLEAIKADGGITFAQDDSAKHDSMPRSAIATGCVDLVLSPAAIGRELARIAKHPFVAGARSARAQDGPSAPPSERQHGKGRAARPRSDGEASAAAKLEGAHERILRLLRDHSGVDFSQYKSSTIERRIARRVVLNRLESLEEYCDVLRDDSKERESLYSDVLISVTSFFRNPETFLALQQKVLPALLKRRSDDPVRCWVLGCSTGQEAYSIAMAFVEEAEKVAGTRRLQIFATDLNEALLSKARQGLYARTLAEEISPERLRRFFVEEGGGYQISKSLREMVVFARQNLIADPPFSRMDLVSCRNLLIYLEPSLQKKAIPTFHYALKPGGFLLLGASESVAGFTDLFEPVDKKQKIYVKRAGATPALHLPARREPGEPNTPRPQFPSRAWRTDRPEDARGELDAQREADRLVLSQFGPPGVLVNADLQVLQFRGKTGVFLEPPSGKASFDVMKMAREGLLHPLRSAINQASKDDRPAHRKDVRVKRGDRAHTFDLEVIPLRSKAERCFLVLFHDVEKGARRAPPTGSRSRAGATSKDSRDVVELERELSETREYYQALREEHETAAEELQAANEEVQSANEELQSVNEELETSKEELESANEELTTINEEMVNRNGELSQVNNDLINLQTSAKLAIVLLGRDLTIRRFSTQAEKLFDLLIADLGRPIGRVRHGLVLGNTAAPVDLESLSGEVVSTLREQEHEVRDAEGRWHSLRLRPYMTHDNKVDGAVLALVDIDAPKRNEQALRESEARYRAMFDSTSVGVGEAESETGRLLQVNEEFARIAGYPADELIGRALLELTHPTDRPGYVGGLTRLIQGDLDCYAAEQRLVRQDGSTVWSHVTLNLIRESGGRPLHMVAITLDITERKRLEEVPARLAAIVAASDDAIISMDLRGTISTWNQGAQRIFGYSPEEAIGEPIALLLPVGQLDDQPSIVERVARGEVVEHYEARRRRRDDSLIDVSLTVSPIRDAAGEVVGAAEIARDITERKRLERDLLRHDAELSAADKRKNEFLAMLGHELRNPLAAIDHGLELLRRVPDDAAQAEELRALLTRQTSRIGALLDQLLDVARVASGKVELASDRVDLASVVALAVETVRPLFEEQRHEVSVALPTGEQVLVLGDAVRLAQVVENLLTNAAKYTDPGGRIGVTLESDLQTARIIVRDDGMGMSPELLPHVFEVFTQGPVALDRAKGGLGLGLPLARRLVEMHGGRVEASSAGLGQGSEFIITLPRLVAPRALEPAAAKSGPSEPDAIVPRRVLVVDDGQDVAATLAAALGADGHLTLAVGDGQAALEAAHTFAPEVVLLDLGLPLIDGYEVARRLRQEHGDKKLLLVALTGYQRDAARLKMAGFDHHLIKPASIQQISALIAAWSRKRGPAP